VKHFEAEVLELGPDADIPSRPAMGAKISTVSRAITI